MSSPHSAVTVMSLRLVFTSVKRKVAGLLVPLMLRRQTVVRCKDDLLVTCGRLDCLDLANEVCSGFTATILPQLYNYTQQFL